MRQLEAADLLRNGPGESALFVPKKFAFKEARWEWQRNSH